MRDEVYDPLEREMAADELIASLKPWPAAQSQCHEWLGYFLYEPPRPEPDGVEWSTFALVSAAAFATWLLFFDTDAPDLALALGASSGAFLGIVDVAYSAGRAGIPGRRVDKEVLGLCFIGALGGAMICGFGVGLAAYLASLLA